MLKQLSLYQMDLFSFASLFEWNSFYPRGAIAMRR